MNEIRRRGAYPSNQQKSALMRLVREKPQLLSGKFSATFTFRKAQSLWEQIASELNAIPGANKDWRQWRKTWQDLRCKTKSKEAASRRDAARTGGGAPAVNLLTPDKVNVLSTICEASISGHAAPQGIASFEWEVIPIHETLVQIELQPEPQTEQKTGSQPQAEQDPGPQSHAEREPRPQSASVPAQRGNLRRSQEVSAALLAQGERNLEIKEEKLRIFKEYYDLKKDYLKRKLEILERNSM